ncbi:DUF1002 domain-containing protein [Adlercreutzia sp. ZJ176]|uniref:DUF1002 domain-containing protein n=1 Tax=Adlercreutzia sp. ZJ176 TaxID=2709407 RepID=UPI0013EA0E0E|nr:DUF1002 domain-containing protein [Adlercreutzia sp. ZJ176]
MATRLVVDETVLARYAGERWRDCACWDVLSALELAGCVELRTTPGAYAALERALGAELPEEAVRAALRELRRFVPACAAGAGGALGAAECEDLFRRWEEERGVSFGLVDL